MKLSREGEREGAVEYLKRGYVEKILGRRGGTK